MDPSKALNVVANLCSNKECCSHDIRKKLLRWEIPEQDIIRILEFLYQHKFLDDTRFTVSYARDKFRFNKWGKQKISQMLKQKGFSQDIINTALIELDKEDYNETCFHLLTGKMKTIKDTDAYKIRAKLTRFALMRGFDFDTINKCINQLIDVRHISNEWDG